MKSLAPARPPYSFRSDGILADTAARTAATMGFLRSWLLSLAFALVVRLTLLSRDFTNKYAAQTGAKSVGDFKRMLPNLAAMVAVYEPVVGKITFNKGVQVYEINQGEGQPYGTVRGARAATGGGARAEPAALLRRLTPPARDRAAPLRPRPLHPSIRLTHAATPTLHLHTLPAQFHNFSYAVDGFDYSMEWRLGGPGTPLSFRCTCHNELQPTAEGITLVRISSPPSSHNTPLQPQYAWCAAGAGSASGIRGRRGWHTPVHFYTDRTTPALTLAPARTLAPVHLHPRRSRAAGAPPAHRESGARGVCRVFASPGAICLR